MGKKGTKRKTQWRTLSITECPPQHLKSALTKQYSTERNNVNITSTTETNNIEGVISQDDDCSNHESSYSNPTYLNRKSSTSSNYRNDYRNNSRYNYYSKHNSASSTSSLHSSSRYTSYRRRPFSSLQNGTSRYSYYGAERTTSRGHRATQSSASLNRGPVDSSKKLHFNEDDYTRISTPRQDVIFKKGCFSQPKKYVSSTDTNTTSSAAASIVSGEESVSALSLPSLSPEQCSSIADSLDPEQGFVYSFIDQNGVVYSYVPNGFDQYNGQMMMLPYGYPPYLCSPDVTSPTCLDEETEETHTSVKSPEIPSSDLDETKVIDEVPMDASTSMAASEETLKTQENDDNKECESPSEEATVATDEVTTAVAEDADETKENEEIPDTVQNIAGQFYNYGYPPYYPTPILYPYMIPQQFVPLYGNEFDIPVEEDFNEDIEEENRKRYRCRKKRRNTDGNSTGVSAATTDYSEDETENEEESECHEECRIFADQHNSMDDRELQSQSNETDNKITLNVDVEEFVPRGTLKSTLNVNVQEFHPRSPKESRNFNQPNENSLKESHKESAKAPTLAEVTSLQQSPSKVVEKKRTELTLAEKIKMRLAEEANSVPNQSVDKTQSPLPQRRNAKRQLKPPIRNMVGRKKQEKLIKENSNLTDVRKSPESKSAPQPTQPSYAQIATTGVKGKAKSPPKTDMVTQVTNNEEIKKTYSEEVPNESVPNSLATPNKTAVNENSDSWQTVKPKGKRGKYVKEQLKEEIVRDEPSTEGIPQQVKIIQRPKLTVQEPPQTVEPEVESSILPKIDTADVPTVVPESSVVTSAVTKKTPKPKHRKSSKKTPDSSSKRKKKLEIIEPVFELPKTDKLISTKTNQPILKEVSPVVTDNIVVDEGEIKGLPSLENEDQEETQFASADANFSFDRLYLGKGFGRNPLNILKGFDYKFKPKSILKEEEEMVLSVIKSLNNSTSSSPPKVSPTPSVIDDEDSDEKTIEDTIKFDAQENGSDTDTVSELSVNGSGESKEDACHMDEPDMTTESLVIDYCDQESSESLEDSCSKLTLAETSNAVDEELTCISDKIDRQIEKPIESNKDLMDSFVDLPNDTTSETNAVTLEESSEFTHEPMGVETALSPSKATETLIIESSILDKEDASNDETDYEEHKEIQPALEPLVKKCLINGNEEDLTIDNNEEKGIKAELCAQNSILPLQKENLQNVGLNPSNQENHLTNGESCTLNNLLENDDAIENDHINRLNPGNLKQIDKNQLDAPNTNDQLLLSTNPNEIQLSDAATNKCNDFAYDQNKEDFKSDHILNGISITLEMCNSSEDTCENTTVDVHLVDCADTTKSDQLNDTEIESFTELNKSTSAIGAANGDHDVLDSPMCTSPVAKNEECMPRRSLTQSPFEVKEKLFEDLNDISIPKVDAHLLNGSKDFVACVNALHTIIKSRECSVDPGRSRDTSLEPNQLTKTSVELNCNENDSQYAKNDRATLVQSEIPAHGATDFKACVNSLQKLIKNRECSMESNSDSNLSTNNVSTHNGYLTKDAIKEAKSSNDSARSSPYDLFEIAPQKTQLEETHQSYADEKIANQTELTPNQNIINPLTPISDSDLNFDLIEKESSRTFKTSISCDHSSGIGSDCEDNQPTSPTRTDKLVAQTGEGTPIKPLFPINTSIINDANSPQITTMPINVLPILSQTNSATCDNQSVSYTSSNNFFKENINPSLNSTLRLSDEADGGPNLELSDSSKFPHQEECETNRFPLTDAVRQWLIQESKESTPEPILRIPDNPLLKTLLEKKIQSINFVDEKEWYSTEESGDDSPDCDENEYEEDEADYLQKHRTKPKNLKSNPLHVSSCNVLTIETDSDYNSDSNDHHCTERIDDNTCKRVAENLSDKTENVTDKNDLLEFWDDEFVSNPRKWLLSSESALGSSSNSSTATLTTREKRSPSTDPEPYVSVYGQTIDYKQLQANKYESLSNNILSVNTNSKNSADIKSSHNYQAAIEQTQQSEIPLGSNNNFYNDNDINKCNAVKNDDTCPTATAIRNPPLTNTENCLKPPEVCCILM